MSHNIEENLWVGQHQVRVPTRVDQRHLGRDGGPEPRSGEDDVCRRLGHGPEMFSHGQVTVQSFSAEAGARHGPVEAVQHTVARLDPSVDVLDTQSVTT